MTESTVIRIKGDDSGKTLSVRFRDGYLAAIGDQPKADVYRMTASQTRVLYDGMCKHYEESPNG